jgi:hypothetical protein
LTDNQSNACLQCDNLYYVSNGNCVAIRTHNCAISDGVNNACLQCNPFYYILKGACVQWSAIQALNCIRSDGVIASCYACLSGYNIPNLAQLSASSANICCPADISDYTCQDNLWAGICQADISNNYCVVCSTGPGSGPNGPAQPELDPSTGTSYYTECDLTGH